MFNDHDGGVGDVYPDFDDGGGNEKVEFARRKFRHDGLLVFGRHFAVQQGRPQFGVC